MGNLIVTCSYSSETFSDGLVWMLTTLKVLVFVSSLQQHLVLNLHFIENNSKYQFY